MLIYIVTLKEGDRIYSISQTYLTIETSFPQNSSWKTLGEVVALLIKFNIFVTVKILIGIIIQPRWFK